MKILEVNNLTKRYTNKLALNDVTFSVEKGSVFGILGPNGAGKTTLLRIINNILVSDFGNVLVNNLPSSKEISYLLGYMPEERGLYDNMTVEDQILYFGLLRGGDKAKMRKKMDEYLQLFNLSSEKKRKLKELSKGNQQKVQIISTIVHQPQLVIFDEPFSGFDPINGAILRELINHLREEGTTVILSSHNMPAIEEICSDIIILNHGEIIVAGSIEDIKENHKKDEIVVTTNTPLMLDMLHDSGLIESVEPTKNLGWRKGYSYKIVKKKEANNLDLINNISIQSEITFFEEALPSLNEIFLQHTKSNNE